jgi:hypothetical protein
VHLKAAALLWRRRAEAGMGDTKKVRIKTVDYFGDHVIRSIICLFRLDVVREGTFLSV